MNLFHNPKLQCVAFFSLSAFATTSLTLALAIFLLDASGLAPGAPILA